MQDDPYDLDRYLQAQKAVFNAACTELRAGNKRSHWMWFVFPQIRGLGHSEMAQKYAIASLQEARAYLQHPVLGPRLLWTSKIMADLQDKTATAVLGSPDDMKFHSSMTLFAQADPTEPTFAACLKQYFGGELDAATLALL